MIDEEERAEERGESVASETGVAATGGRGRGVAALFGLTSFVASALIFVVEPLVARTLLPTLGGDASVWNSAMFTFQVLLLVGYLIAHLGASHLPVRWFPVAAVGLAGLAVLALPVGLRDGWQAPPSAPAMWTILAVAAAVAAPFVALACVSPTLQRWYGGLHPEADPYVLYAAGNVGSFVGLLAYPLAIERWSGIHDQRVWWTRGYVAFLVLFGVCGFLAFRGGQGWGRASRAEGTPAPRRDLLRWGAMAAGPSLLLLGVTRHVSTDIAAVPLLWVVPLGLYLLTFVIAFSGKAQKVIAVSGRLGMVFGAVTLVSLAASLPGTVGVALHLLTFFLLVLAVHGRLVDERPPVENLTSYYLALSTGGAIGGVVGGLVAPVTFPGIWEYPLGILASIAWLTPRSALGPKVRPVAAAVVAALVIAGFVMRLNEPNTIEPPRTLQILLGVAMVAAFACSRRSIHLTACLGAIALVAVVVPTASTLEQVRTYYGVARVLEATDGTHLLVSGTTVHGAQRPDRPDELMAYYADGGPISEAVRQTAGPKPRSVGVIGLGSGAIAAYARPGDAITFYEIDPAVIDIATNPDLFSFIDRSKGKIDVVEGDGRRALAAVEDGAHDVVVIDAFSSDSIPVHLLTTEALAEYRRVVGPDGLVVFHVSNRYFDLVPVVSRLAANADLGVLAKIGVGERGGSFVATVVAVGPPDALAALRKIDGWVEPLAGEALWTDDHADVLGSLQIN